MGQLFGWLHCWPIICYRKRLLPKKTISICKTTKTSESREYFLNTFIKMYRGLPEQSIHIAKAEKLGAMKI
jgi:hypothetical protein